MGEYTGHQKKIIARSYDRHDTIMLTKLQELVTELYLADSPKKQNTLWGRAKTAMTNLKVKPALLEHILVKRDPALLARNVQDWLKAAEKQSKE